MKDIQIFNSPQFGEIRTAVAADGQPLFCLADLCQSLGLETNNTIRRLSGGVCSKHPITDTLGRIQQANFVNEDGLYDVILDSRKPEARAFRKWITSEVLPSIRRTGAYAVTIPGETQEQMIARALITAQQTMARQEKEIALLRQLNDERARTIELQQLVIEERKSDSVIRPHLFGRREGKTEQTFTSTRIAAELGCAVHALVRLLRHNGVFVRNGRRWVLGEKYASDGLQIPVRYTYSYSYGELTSTRAEWTAKGREFVISMYNNKKV